MVAALDDWLTRAMDLPWVWGRTDCTMWVADWCVQHFGHDPAAAFRGMYDDEAGAEGLIIAGLAQTIRPWMAPLRVTDTPVRGDVGVIDVRGRQVSAIWTGRRWAFRTPRALAECPMPHIIAWSN